MQTTASAGFPVRLSTLAFWVAACAVGFAFYARLTPRLQPEFRVLGMVYNLVMALAMGTTLTGLAALQRRNAQGDLLAFTAPGHWLLALGGAAVFIDVLFATVLPSGDLSRGSEAYWLIFSVAHAPFLDALTHQATTWGLGLVAAAVFLYLAWNSLSWLWRGVFASFILGAAIFPITATTALLGGSTAQIAWCHRLPHLYAGLMLAWLILLLVTAALSHRRQPGDIFHWLGVVACVVVAAMQLATYKAFF